VIDSVDSITTEDGITVKDRESIEEFLDECSRITYDEIKKNIENLVQTFKVKPIDLVCDNEECGKEFKTSLTFDHSNFFG
jgi:hypothetical protein